MIVEDGGYGMMTGLLNSATFVNQMLINEGVDSNLVVVHDNNDIDREVTKYRPSIVIIEALWVVPEKFEILHKLHPKVKWIIRLHSATPFIANEGIAMKWIFDYLTYPNVFVSCNDERILDEVRFLVQHKFDWTHEEAAKTVLFQPNYYPQDFQWKHFSRHKDTIDIACFGAIRPMKNQLIQAIAAIEFADSIGKKLNFHINGNRIEMKGQPVLHNIEGLFNHVKNRSHNLIVHDWCSHEEFKKLCATMDMALQVSYSETFNIVAADLITCGVPLVTSDEVRWATRFCYADPNDSRSIVKIMKRIYKYPQINVLLNQYWLRKFCEKTVRVWDKELEKLTG